MPNLTIPRVVLDGTVFTQSQNDTQCSSIETLLNTTKLDSANIQNGAITTPLLANSAVTSSNIAAGAVGTSAIAANAVTGALLNANVVDNASLQYASNQLSVKAAGITNSMIASGAVGQAQLAAKSTGTTVAAGGVAVSATANYGAQATSWTDVPNLAVTITTTGRPVRLLLIPDTTATAGAGAAGIYNQTGAAISFQFLNGSTSLGAVQIPGTGGTPVWFSPFENFDFPAAGTYTYKLQVTTPVSPSYQIQKVRLLAYEI